jgi:methylenetetrahydrofolate reductase (NADPH)
MGFRQDLEKKNFVITAELNPPKGTDPALTIANAKRISKLVSAINITDNSGANMKMCSLALSFLVEREAGIETIWQMTCRDRNRLALQSDLLGGRALGLKNILPLKGDEPKTGDHAETAQCFDWSTEDLLKAIANLKQGKDFNENPVSIDKISFDYCVGSAAHPGLADTALEGQCQTMKRRSDLGVEFFQTQICFEIDQIKKFVDSIGEELARKTIVGITPLKTLNQALFIDKNIFGVKVPAAHLSAMEEALAGQDPKSEPAKSAQQKKGLELTRNLVEEIRKLPLKGVHLMAIGQENILDQIIKAISA